MKIPVFQFVLIAHYPVDGCHCPEPGPIHLPLTPYRFTSVVKIPLSSLGSQLFIIRDMLQAP